MHSLNWDVTSEYNLNITGQTLDFILFKDSVWQDDSICDFSDGTSFTLNALTIEGQLLTLFALSKYYVVRKYILRNDGYIAGSDVDLKPFKITTNNVAVFLNGTYVRPTCYTATDHSIRFHIKGERVSGTSELKDYISWSEGDVVKFITNDPDSKKQTFNSYFMQYTSNKATTVLSQNGKNFYSAITPKLSKGKTIVLVNDKIIPYSELSFPGGEFTTGNVNTQGALVIKRNLSEADKVTVFYFEEDFEHFEYSPKTGQTRFQGPDLLGNYLSYSTTEGAGVAQLFEYSVGNTGEVVTNGVPWSNITGVTNGCRLHASCIFNGVSYSGEAEIQDSNMEKSYVSVKIISEFGRKEFDSSEWYISPAYSKNIVSYLDGRTQSTVAFPEILGTFQMFFLDYYQDGLRRLTNIRNVNEVEPDLLIQTLDMLGMRLDMSNVSELNKRRAVREVINFYKRCGTKKSINFLGYINDRVINLDEALWTNDYIHFATPDELGATYERKQLDQFIDYRFIAATAVETDDYGDCLDLKGPFKLKVEGTKLTIPYGSRAFYPNHYTGTEGSMKWNSISDKLELNSEDYSPGDYFLIVIDDHGFQHLDLVENIPSGTQEDFLETNVSYYYNETYNSINMVDDLEVSVSLPVAKVNIALDDYTITLLQEYKTCSFVDDFVFAMTSDPVSDPVSKIKTQTGLSYSYQIIDNEDFVNDRKVELQKSQRLDIKDATGENYLVFINDSNELKDINNVTLKYIPKGYYTNTGIQPVATNHALWKFHNEWFVYDNFAVGLDKYEFTVDESGEIVKDSSGYSDIKYVVKDSWYKSVFIGDFVELPKASTLEEIKNISNTFYAFYNKEQQLQVIYTLERDPEVGSVVYKIADASVVLGVVDSVDKTKHTITIGSATYSFSPSRNVTGRPLCRVDGVYYSLVKRQTYEVDTCHEYSNGNDLMFLLSSNPIVGDIAHTYKNYERSDYVVTSVDAFLGVVKVCPKQYFGTEQQDDFTKQYTRVTTYDPVAEENVDLIVYNYYYTYDVASGWSKIERYFTDVNEAYETVETVENGVVKYTVHLLDVNKNDNYIAYTVYGMPGATENFIPYFNGEIYYDSSVLKYFQFKDGAWVEINAAIVGEFSRGGKASESGKSYKDNFIATENLGERFYLKHQELLNTSSVSVIVNDDTFDIIFDSFDKYDSESYVVLLKKDSVGKWYLQFGDGLHGVRPIKGSKILVTYDSLDFPVMNKFLPYEKLYTNLHKDEHKIGYKKVYVNTWVEDPTVEDVIPVTGYRFEKFTNPESVDTSSIAVFVNGSQWNIVKDKSKYGPYDRVVEIRRARTNSGVFLYVIFGDNKHSQNLRKGDLISVYYKTLNEEIINNNTYLKCSTFKHALTTRVAYDYGLITQTKESEWVYYRNFIPPEGYYPTNHVRFNVNSNSMIDAKDFEAEAKYQFYELASTPWVLENICNIIEFNELYLGVASVSTSVGNLFFRATEELGMLKVSLPNLTSKMTAMNKDQTENIYCVRNGDIGRLEDVNKLKYIVPVEDENGVIWNYMVYTTNAGGLTKYATLVNNLDFIRPGEIFDIKQGDILFAKNGMVIPVTIETDDRNTVTTDLTFTEKGTSVEFKDFTKDCFVKVNVETENKRTSDKVSLYIGGKKVDVGSTLSFKMIDGGKVELDISAEQKGCTSVSKHLTLDISMFNNKDSLVEETLYLKLYEVKTTVFAPSLDCKVNVNGTLYESGSDIITKYGESLVLFAVGDRYIEATENQTVRIETLQDATYYLDLTLRKYRLKVTTRVNGNVDNNQPVYLNGMPNTYNDIWTLGQVVEIVAGGKWQNTKVVSKVVTISSNTADNVYVIDCPVLDDSYLSADLIP